jgi:hypothetical protein
MQQPLAPTRLTDRLKLCSLVLLLATALLMTVVPFGVVSASLLENREARLQTPLVGATGQQRISFTITDFGQPIGSLRFEYCGNSPVIGAVCVPPTGFSASGATILSQSGEAGFSLHPSSNVNNIVLTRASVIPTEGNAAYTFNGITNPTTLGTFYIRLYSYSSTNGTGPAIQDGGIALSTAPEFDVSAEVPPYLRFCAGLNISGLDCSSATDNFINLGEFSAQRTTTTTSQFLAATNAANGYSVRIVGNTLTSGNNIIPASINPSASTIGSSQFGINLRNNTAPNIGANPVGPGTAQPVTKYNQPNLYSYSPNDVIVSSSVGSANRKFTVSYITNISSNQAPGVYAATFSFICLANF